MSDIPETIDNTDKGLQYDGWLNNLIKTHQFLALCKEETTLPKSRLDTDLLLKEFQLHVDLVKHYLDLIIKFNVFYYAVTGGIVSYYFTHSDNALAVWGLALPILISLFFGSLFAAAGRAIPQVDDQLSNLSKLLGFAKPEVRILRFALFASGTLFILVGIILTILLLLAGM